MRAVVIAAVVAFTVLALSVPSLVVAQSPAPAKPAPAPSKSPAKAAAPASTPAPPPPTRPSLVELRQQVEAKKAEVARLQEAPLPGDDEIKKHRAAKATLEETLALPPSFGSRYSYDATGIKRVLQADGTKFFQSAKQAANKKPIGPPAAKATPLRTKVVKDIDALEKVWAQALAKPTPAANDLAPLIDRVQTALWHLK